MFSGRKLAIATMHKKELVIAPVLERLLDVQCVVVDGLNTDQLGTFTGEVERAQDPLTTCRLKCELAFERGFDLALASEGSFGPHPAYFFIPGDEEILCLIDRKNGWEVAIKEVSTSTNFMQSEVVSFDQLKDLLDRAKFPDHAVILRGAKNDDEEIKKGLTSIEEIERIFMDWKDRGLRISMETDMRAMHNPLRMRVIETATEKLAQRVLSFCPTCSTPGFGIVSAVSGLPCEVCGFPTNETKSHIYGCAKCGMRQEKMYPHGRQKGDPMYCNVCNP